MDNPAEWIASLIEGYCDTDENDLGLVEGRIEPAWGTPLVAYASGADPIFAQYKEVVGPFHWTPLELFELAYPTESASPDELTVIAWVLPQTEATKRDNRRQRAYPAERWARSRIMGEQFNNKLRAHVGQMLSEAGYPAVAPMLHPEWQSVRKR